MKIIYMFLLCGLLGDAALAQFEVERGKANAADAVGNTVEIGSPIPGPDIPTPQPGDVCANCNGTGRSGDGLTQCRVCGGDGKMAIGDHFAQLNHRLTTMEVEHRKYHDGLTALERRVTNLERDWGASDMSPQYCDCANTGVCTCEKGKCACKDCPEHTPKPKPRVEEQVEATDDSKVLTYTNSIATTKSWAARENKNVILYFTASWCAPCQKFKREVLLSREVIDAIGSKYAIGIIDRDSLSQAEIAKWGCRMVPHCVLLTSDWGHKQSLNSLLSHDAQSFINKIESAPIWSYNKIGISVEPRTGPGCGDCGEGRFAGVAELAAPQYYVKQSPLYSGSGPRVVYASMQGPGEVTVQANPFGDAVAMQAIEAQALPDNPERRAEVLRGEALLGGCVGCRGDRYQDNGMCTICGGPTSCNHRCEGPAFRVCNQCGEYDDPMRHSCGGGTKGMRESTAASRWRTVRASGFVPTGGMTGCATCN